MQKTNFTCLMVLIYVVFTDIAAGTLSGTVINDYDHPLTNVTISLEGLSSTSIQQTAVTDAEGKYLLEDFPAGSYSIHLEKIMHDSLDTIVLLGDSHTIIDFVMDSIPQPAGTLHSGEIFDETWYPKDNPHVVTRPIEIRGTLFIAPGCTVNVQAGIQITGSLRIGASSGGRTVINGDPVTHIYANSRCMSVDFINCTFYGLRFDRFNCAKLAIRNCKMEFYSGAKPDLIADELSIDSSSVALNDSGGINLNAHNSVTITNSLLRGARWIQSSKAGSNTIRSYCIVSGETVKIYNTTFKPDLQVSFGPDASPPESPMVITVNYCILENAVVSHWVDDSFLKATINHCNFDNFRMNALYQDSVSNCILNTVTGDDKTVTSYSSLLTNSIIAGTALQTGIFGFLENIRTNRNGDSCDLWYNMRTDPLFADSDSVVISDSSPAIGAATDGTTIGYYQGPSGIPPLRISTRPVFIRKTSNVPSPMIAVSGNSIELRAQGASPQYAFFLIDQLGRTVYRIPRMQSQSVTFDFPALPPGIYIAVLKNRDHEYSRRIPLYR